MELEKLVDGFLEYRAPGWLTLDRDEALNCAVNALRFYAGYGPLSLYAGRRCLDKFDENVKVSTGEWAIIAPLFILYLEFENAQRLEAARANGLEVHGRATESIKGDINALEKDIVDGRGFVQPIVVLGIDGTDSLPLPVQEAIPLSFYLSLLR